MSATSSESADETDAGTWATESLPMTVRKELLERELSKLGFRKAAAQAGSPSHDGAGGQQQGEAASTHPRADDSGSSQHGE
jgi:hypothetical protein